MNLQLSKKNNSCSGSIVITGSKSETNRLLLLQALFPQLTIKNISNSDDAKLMAKGLQVQKGTVDIHHAGTAMRFLTGYFANKPEAEVVLTGSDRMQHRPIKILVDALRDLGADIQYVQSEGYPPLSIKGKRLENKKVRIPANISSQYITSLILLGVAMPKGLKIVLEGEITSVPYIRMTLALLHQIGVRATFNHNTIQVFPPESVPPKTITVESDWSAASYYYSIVALSELGSSIRLSAYTKESLQGDAILQELYTFFGVETLFKDNTVTLTKVSKPKGNSFVADLSQCPDIAQTIAVTCFGLGIACELTGLHTLKIKETDRLLALQTELRKLGATIKTTLETLVLDARIAPMVENQSIATYNDHRMAMAFAPLGILGNIEILEAEVVSKSYPRFWEDLKLIGFVAKEN